MQLKTKLRIELLWSVMGGMLFSQLPLFGFSNGRFDIYKNWLNSSYWDYSNLGTFCFLDEFIFGFIFTYIFVKSLRRYNE